MYESDQKVEKHKAEVEIELGNGARMLGTLFIKQMQRISDLMNDSRHDGRLFGDISAVTALNRSGRALRRLIRDRGLHPRLVNGSDYPMPALGFLFSPAKLRFDGYLDAEEQRLCGRIQDANPLLFDFVVKRSLKVTEDGLEHRFSPGVFQTSWLFRKTAGSRSEATA